MKNVMKVTNRIAAMLLSGMLVAGSVPIAAFGTEIPVDPDTGIETSVVVEDTDEFIPEEETEDNVIEQTNGETVSEEETVTSYTVTLDANGGYFSNEWDDVLNETLETAEAVTKLIPIGGTVTSFPVLEQENATVTFLGWSLEPNGELVSQGYEEYIPVDNCVLYAVWQIQEIPEESEETEGQEEKQVEDVSEDIPSDEQQENDTNNELINETLDDGTSEEPNTTSREMENVDEISNDGDYQVDTPQDTIEEEGQEEFFSTTAAMGVVESGTCGAKVTWTLDKEGTLTISGSGEMYDYDFQDSPFFRNDNINKVVIEDGVTSIGSGVFLQCDNLSSITIPESVTSIGSRAFNCCSQLTGITIPESVTSIGSSAFNGCSQLTGITIPESVTSIGDGAFSSCSGLLSITIPGSVTSIGSRAFSECNSLNSITIREGVTSISDRVFYNCFSLSSITIPVGVTSIGNNAFDSCNTLSSITIPGSVTSIGGNAFYDCPNLTISGNQNTYIEQYCDDFSIPFNPIDPMSISSADVTLPDQTYIYTGEALEPKVVVFLGEDQLTKGIDYTVAYSNNTNAGTATVTINGVLRYSGSVGTTFTIEKAEQSITASDMTLTYPNSGKIEVSGNHGELSYKSSDTNIVTVDSEGKVTATGAGTATVTITAEQTPNYNNAATKTITVTINPESIDEVVDIDRLEPLPYTGKEQSPIPSVHISDRILSIGTDFTATYENNINVGTATITITGKGNYTGTKTATFKIEPASITDSSITGLSTKTYTGKAITQTPVVKSGSTTLIEGSDYTVSYKNNTNPGTATVIITGSGNYTGTKEVTFTINAVGWIQESGEWYYYKNDGTKLTNGWAKDSKGWYWLDASGKITKSKWIKSGGSWYYLGSNGIMTTGWQKVGGKWYYMNSSGIMTTGWQRVGGKWYNMNASGIMTTGWQKVGGKWYYMNSSGIMTTGWQKVGGKWYYMNASGIMTTGWQNVGDKWYYMNSSGIMTTGWEKVSGNWYYMNSSGIMTTGWQQIGGKWHYMNSSGIMTTGWQEVGGNWYYMNSSGIMTTGWQMISGKWYYFNASGVWVNE